MGREIHFRLEEKSMPKMGREGKSDQEKISTKSRDGDGKRRGREIHVKDTLHCLKHQKRN